MMDPDLVDTRQTKAEQNEQQARRQKKYRALQKQDIEKLKTDFATLQQQLQSLVKFADPYLVDYTTKIASLPFVVN